jgi:methylmalonyl-CoA mutase
MKFPEITVAQWRAQVEKDLAGVPFDKALVYTTPEGLAVQPLYTESREPGPFTRGLHASPSPFRVCMRYQDDAALAEDLAGGAEAIWFNGPVSGAIDLRRVFLIVDDAASLLEAAARQGVPEAELRFAVLDQPTAAQVGMISTLSAHRAGADAADELAIALSSGAAHLGALLEAGLDATSAARNLGVQISVGRDTFAELCKLRALRTCWQKLFAAAGAPDAPLALLHAVCSPRTLTERDPWVNQLRVTTQIFSAVLGGADLVTPAAFDEALGAPGALGRRVARNSALVLREESHLGRVADAGGGSYYIEALTDALAREAWRRFQSLEREGGIAAAIESGSLKTRLDAAWKKRRELIVKRREAITGVSEFANLGEEEIYRRERGERRGEDRRDAEPFERLRDRADELAKAGHAPRVRLSLLGPRVEHRARLDFAAGFFAAGGFRVGDVAEIACICGSDERYAADAAERARSLKAAGCRRVLLAGRPGALEPALREAGVDGFIFVGCDVVAVLSELL